MTDMLAAVCLAGAALVLGVPPARRADAGTGQALAARIEALEAQEAIRGLWADYGRTLDARDFVAFSKLFARDAEFGGPGAPGQGPGRHRGVPREGHRHQLPDSKGKNFHLYFNESIDVQGDRATAISKGGFVMATADNSKADFLLLCDLIKWTAEFVREDGTWKFSERPVIGEIPVPRAAAR